VWVPVTLFSLSSDMATLGRARSEVEEKLEMVAIGFLGPTAAAPRDKFGREPSCVTWKMLI